MELVYAPNKWLEKEVQDFDFDKHKAVDIAQEMVDLMVEKDGIGLSANQVGLDAKIFVIQPNMHKDIKMPFAVINPVIQKVSEETYLDYEGCLSHPGLYLKVRRPLKLVAKFLDADAKECIIELDAIDSRCFLHEYDHLYGVEFTDRVSKLKLKMAMKKKMKAEKRVING